MTARAAAGWYLDPAKRHELRYWDGGEWSLYVADAGTVTQDSTRGSPTTRSPTPWASWRHNRLAWIGLWLGVANAFTLWLLGAVLGPAAIVLGILGAIRADRRSEIVASVIAIVLGIVGTITGIVLIALTRDPSFQI